MVSKELRAAWKFFHEWAGYCVGRRAAGALALARAEAQGRECGLSFEWVDDGESLPSDGLCTCGCGNKIETCEGCICRDESGNVVASLWSIWDAGCEYRRVVEAELASEALHEMTEREVTGVLSL